MRSNDDNPIHVAGIIDAAEAELLIDCGVEYLGFPLVLGYHAEDLPVKDAAAIVTTLGRRATFFLITYLDTASEIIDLCGALGVDMVQLHGDIRARELTRLRTRAPQLKIIKSLIVCGDNLAELAVTVRSLKLLVDGFITDTFDPQTGATGATGKAHDWSISKALVEMSDVPVILAGGLRPGNVGAAIATVRPAGVDVHTGIEGPDGRKDRALVTRFLAEAKAAFGEL